MNFIKVIFFFLVFNSFAQNTGSFSSVEIGQEEPFSFAFNLTNSEPVKAIQFDIDLNFQSIILLENHNLTSRADGFSLTVNVIDNNTLRVVLISTEGKQIEIGDGPLFSLNMQSQKTPGINYVNIYNEIISDVDGKSIEIQKESSSITILGPVYNLTSSILDFGKVRLGQDMNRSVQIRNDGTQNLVISSADISSPFSFISEFPITISPGSSYYLNTSVDTSFKHSSTQTVTFITNDLDTERAKQSIVLKAEVFTFNEIFIGSSEGGLNSEIRIPISINNQQEINGFQFDVILPEGVSYVQNSAEFSSRSTDHVLTASEVNKNLLRVVAYSSTNDNFSGFAGEILSFKLKPLSL